MHLDWRTAVGDARGQLIGRHIKWSLAKQELAGVSWSHLGTPYRAHTLSAAIPRLLLPFFSLLVLRNFQHYHPPPTTHLSHFHHLVRDVVSDTKVSLYSKLTRIGIPLLALWEASDACKYTTWTTHPSHVPWDLVPSPTALNFGLQVHTSAV